MALTPNYGLSYFGGDVAGGLTDDGSKYTGTDRLSFDRMLKALASSLRHYRATGSQVEPSTPTVDVGVGGGLPGGMTYTYCVTLVDHDGLETMASPEVSVTTPAILEPPDEPGITEGEGTLGIGLYYYALTAIRGDEETAQGPQVSITLIEPGGVALVLPAPPEGGELFQVWRMGANDVGWTRLAQVAAVEGGEVLDDGSVLANTNADDPGQAPPMSNAGVAIYAATITLEAADAALATTKAIQGWKIYRTETASSYPAASLVHLVIDLDDPTDSGDPDLPLMTSWVDEGDPLVSGIPPIASAQLHLAPYVLDHADVLPDPTGYPAYYPLIAAGVLYAIVDGAWVAVSSAGGGSTAAEVTFEPLADNPATDVQAAIAAVDARVATLETSPAIAADIVVVLGADVVLANSDVVPVMTFTVPAGQVYAYQCMIVWVPTPGAGLNFSPNVDATTGLCLPGWANPGEGTDGTVVYDIYSGQGVLRAGEVDMAVRITGQNFDTNPATVKADLSYVRYRRITG